MPFVWNYSSFLDSRGITGYIYTSMSKKALIIPVLLLVIMASVAPAKEVLINPDPFDPSKGSAGISYALEKDSDVAVYIFGPGGRLLLKKACISGTNGGRAGLNQVEWNGKSEFGDTAENGSYAVRVVEQENMRLVGSGRLEVIEGYVSKRGKPLNALAVLLLIMTGLVAANGTLRLYGLIRRRKK